MLTAQHFTPGTVIIEQGTTGAHCYLLIAGEVEVILKRDGENQTLLTLSQGEIFGERSMLTMQPTTASASRLIDPEQKFEVKPKQRGRPDAALNPGRRAIPAWRAPLHK